MYCVTFMVNGQEFRTNPVSLEEADAMAETLRQRGLVAGIIRHR